MASPTIPRASATTTMSTLATTTSSSAPLCTGCTILADFSQVIFAEYMFTVNELDNGLTRTSGQVIPTTVILPTVAFNASASAGSFRINGSPSTNGANFVSLGPSNLTVGGIVLTQPTAYYVFQNWTQIRRSAGSQGFCTTLIEGSGVLPLSTQIALNDMPTKFLDAEQAFIDSLSITCGPLSASSTITSTASSTPTVSPDPGSEALSTGVKAGIGIGVSAVVLLIIALIAMLLWRRGKGPKGLARFMILKGDTARAELETGSRCQEMTANTRAQEVGGGLKSELPEGKDKKPQDIFYELASPSDISRDSTSHPENVEPAA